ncbi:hypothetical protein BH20VER1_BH20VER1_12700 [soil metagenome]
MADDVTVAVQLSEDFALWLAGSGVTTEVGRVGSGVETITVRDNRPATGQRQMFRLQIALVPPPNP